MKIYVRAAIADIWDESPEVRYELATDPTTDPTVLEQLADSDYIPLLRELVKNPNCDDATYIKLAKVAVKTKDYRIAISLVENPHTPASALMALIDYDTHAHAVMDPIIKHPNVTLEVLEKLLKVDNGYCGYLDVIAESQRLPDDFLWEFARNGCEMDKRNIAGIPYTPTEILEYLIMNEADTQSGYIKGDALSNPNLDISALRRYFNSTGKYHNVIKNPNCPSDILVQAADEYISDANYWGLRTVSSHPNTPIDTLYRIFESTMAWEGLARNPNIPADIAQQIATSGNDYERSLVAANPYVDPTVLATLVKGGVVVRKALAKNPSTPAKTLLKLAKDRSMNVVYAVTDNPNLPEEVFVYLMNKMGDWWAIKKHLDRFPQYKGMFDRD